jgi:hypothetical protein
MISECDVLTAERPVDKAAKVSEARAVPCICPLGAETDVIGLSTSREVLIERVECKLCTRTWSRHWR